ncbi:hypothetical protein RBSH_00598 [Rhodopirellula baltica SH28]|uniref:Uncharacterized protein n=1 Tax=Rhodopirellula baltica SH28 TaxID=993517 RepID=K5DAU8_RHOBT|nr:hypothetical protein RBSH_00598 [Rhodopirellula baltica SH28]
MSVSQHAALQTIIRRCRQMARYPRSACQISQSPVRDWLASREGAI